MNNLFTEIKIVTLKKGQTETGTDLAEGECKIRMREKWDTSKNKYTGKTYKMPYRAIGQTAQSLKVDGHYKISGEWHNFIQDKDENGNAQNPKFLIVIDDANLVTPPTSKPNNDEKIPPSSNSKSSLEEAATFG